MKKDKKSGLDNETPLRDLVNMQTEVGLFASMRESKTLTALVVIACIIIAVFFYFLSKATGG